jgi:drug/metabolite transporter (DMT)-like permease
MKLPDLSARIDRLPGPARAGLWMSLSSFGYAGSAAIVKHLSDTLPIFEIAFFRNLFGLMFMLPWLLRTGIAALRTDRLPMHALRGMLSAINMWCMFAAFAIAPIADVSAISFLMPVIGSLLAVMFFRERSSPARWLAVLAGFAGALIVIRPGMSGFNAGLLFAVVAVLAGSIVAMMIKTLVRTDGPDTVVVYLFVSHVVYSAIPMVVVWRTPDVPALLWLVALGWLGMVVQRCFNRGMAAADATVALPFNFSRLVWAALFGWLLFAEFPDGWTWLGGAAIFLSSVWLVRMGAAKPGG